jgi:MYXO-CTERM domain-containing protein
MPVRSIAFVLIVAGSCSAEGFTNPSFETGNFTNNHPGDNTTTLGVGATNIDGWTVISAEVAWIGDPNPFALFASDGSRFLDLTSYPGGAGGVKQDLVTIPGYLYTIEFDLGSRAAYGDAFLSVRASDAQGEAGVAQYTQLGQSAARWERNSFEFTAREAVTSISFIHDFGGSNYTGLDNITVRSVAPAPGALAVLGLAGLAGRRRR